MSDHARAVARVLAALDAAPATASVVRCARVARRPELPFWRRVELAHGARNVLHAIDAARRGER